MTTRTLSLLLAVPLAAGTIALGTSALADPAPVGVPRDAQDAAGFRWFWTISGPVGADAGNDIVVDEAGNMFLMGTHDGLDLDRDGTLDLPSDGMENLLVKLRQAPGGGVTVDWIRSPASPGFNAAGSRIATDGQGGVFAMGRFQQYVTFDDDGRLEGRGANDGFLARYGPDGRVLWRRVIGGPGQDAPTDVSSDAAGNVYVVGWGEGTFALDDRGADFRGDGMAGLIVSFDAQGDVRWAHAVPAPNRIIFGVDVAADGEVFVMGELEADADFDADGQIDLRASPDRDGFVARFDTEGTLLGAWAIPSPGRLAHLAGGDVLVAGAHGGPMDERYGPVDFDRDGRPDIRPRGGPAGAWVARLSRDGELRWVRSYEIDTPADIEVDGGRFILTGSYNGVRDIDEDGAMERVDHRSEQDRFNTEMAILLASAEDGRPERAWTAPGPGKDHAAAALVAPDRSLFVTGYIQYTADFTGDGEMGEGWIECESLGDVFFARYELPPAAEGRRIVLESSKEEVSGVGWGVSLSWSGAVASNMDIYLNDALLQTISNDGVHGDTIPPATYGRGPYRFKVCEAGTTVCSNESVP